MARLTIGRLARRAGVKVSTVRVYERHGLLEEPARSSAGYREYLPELLALFDDPDTGCAEVRAQAEEKLADIRARLRDLRRIQRSLTDLTKACTGKGPTSGCPIFQALERNDDER